MNKYNQIPTNINNNHKIPPNINTYQQRSRNIKTCQQISKPEVYHWPYGGPIYHICYAQTTNTSMALPGKVNNNDQVATTIDKY